MFYMININQSKSGSVISCYSKRMVVCRYLKEYVVLTILLATEDSIYKTLYLVSVGEIYPA